MDFKEKKIIYWLIFLVAMLVFVLLLMPALNNKRIVKAPNETLQDGKMAYVTLVYPDKKRAFEGEITDGMTANDILAQASFVGNLGYKINGVNSVADYEIDGMFYNGGKKWNCYLNNALVSPKSADEVVINDKDKMICKYE